MQTLDLILYHIDKGGVVLLVDALLRELFNCLQNNVVNRRELQLILSQAVVMTLKKRGKTRMGKKWGKIKMDLWELPPVDPSKLSSTNEFAESNVWLPFTDSNHGQGD